MTEEDNRALAKLRNTRYCNNRYGWMMSDYLNNTPCAITPSLMKEINYNGLLPDERIYAALLSGFCGLDENDKQMLENYFIPSVHKLCVKQYLNNPYLHNIRIPNTSFGKWKLKTTSYKAYEAFVCNDIVLTPDFREIPQIGFFDEDFSFPCVEQDDREWMAIKPNEVETMNDAVDKSVGDVLTLGLGMGYYTYMVSMKSNVNSVTVVELDPNVIELFTKHILPQFENKSKIRIIQSDAFNFLESSMKQGSYNFVFADIWHDTLDGLPLYIKLKKFEKNFPQTSFYYWVEQSLLSAFRWSIFDDVVSSSPSMLQIEHDLSDVALKQKLSSI